MLNQRRIQKGFIRYREFSFCNGYRGLLDNMSDGKMSVFYVVATVLVLLSISLVTNGNVSADTFHAASQSASSFLANILLPGSHHGSGTLFDMYCYDHNQLFGLRF